MTQPRALRDPGARGAWYGLENQSVDLTLVPEWPLIVKVGG